MSIKLEYWGPDQEKAVVDFLNIGTIILIDEGDEDNPPKAIWSGDTYQERERNRIFETHLKDPLDRMVDIIIRRYKLFSKTMDYQDQHADTISFLMCKAHKFESDKNKKSYSYFGTIIKHYLIGQLMKDHKKLSKTLFYDDYAHEVEENEEYSYEIDKEDIDLNLLLQTISSKIKSEMQNMTNLSDNEINVGNAIIKILDDWFNLFGEVSGSNKFNKNLILYYIREMTCLSTKEIRQSMKRYKFMYDITKKDFI